MVNNERFESNGQADGSSRPSDETLVGRAEAGPVPVKQGEMGYVPPAEPGPTQASNSTDDLPARHPADHSPAPPAPTLPPDAPQGSNASTMTRPSFKKFLRPRRPLPTINGIRSATVLRVVFITLTLAASIIGWAVAVTRLNAWNKNSVFEPPPPPQNINSTESGPLDQMPQSSLVFVHVAFGAAVLFQLFILERSVYRLRAERYAYLHPEEMASTTEVNGVMGLSPWNRPPLPTYAAALGVRGTGDVEDLMIAAPPPPEYGNVRGSTLLLASHFPRPQTDDQRDVLGRPRHDWSRPVSYGEDEMRENLRRSLDLEAALARLEGPTRPENALTRR